MTDSLVSDDAIQTFLDRIAGLDQSGGDDRVKRILRRVVGDLFATIDDFDITEDEFWKTLNFLAEGAPEFGLWAAGLGFEHFLDVRLDAAEHRAGKMGGTPRTIEGPLYVAGAPRKTGFARLDDGADAGEVLIMKGRVLDGAGQPIADAVVDVWHANTLGSYSYFDKSQSAFNLRRQIATDREGRYKFQSILPSGYSVPPQGSTDRLLRSVGRHGNRPAHIHFFVSAPGHLHLTTQINIADDPYVHDDFAYATRDELIAPIHRREDAEAIRAEGLNTPFSEIEFDFVLNRTGDIREKARSTRPRASQAD